MTTTTKSTALNVIDSSSLDLANIQPSIEAIMQHIKDSVADALGGLTPQEFVETHELDLSKDSHKRKLTSISSAVSKSKTTIDKLLKAKQDELEVEAKKIKAIRKEYKLFCDTLRDDTQQPVLDYKAEQERKEAAAAQAIVKIKDYVTPPYAGGGMLKPNADIQYLTALIGQVKAIDTTDPVYHDRKQEAELEKSAALGILQNMVFEKQQAEKQEAEQRALAQFNERMNMLDKYARSPSQVFGGRLIDGLNSMAVQSLIKEVSQLEAFFENQDYQTQFNAKKADVLSVLESKQAQLKEQEAAEKLKAVTQASPETTEQLKQEIKEQAKAEAAREQAEALKQQEAEFKRSNELLQRAKEAAQAKKQEQASQTLANQQKMVTMMNDIVDALLASNEAVEAQVKSDDVYSKLSDEDKQTYLTSKLIDEPSAKLAAAALLKSIKYKIDLPHIAISLK
jgi:hypothetical protein